MGHLARVMALVSGRAGVPVPVEPWACLLCRVYRGAYWKSSKLKITHACTYAHIHTHTHARMHSPDMSSPQAYLAPSQTPTRFLRSGVFKLIFRWSLLFKKLNIEILVCKSHCASSPSPVAFPICPLSLPHGQYSQGSNLPFLVLNFGVWRAVVSPSFPPPCGPCSIESCSGSLSQALWAEWLGLEPCWPNWARPSGPRQP